MAAVRKGITITFGLLSTTGSTYSALDKPTSGNKQVCTGKGTHDVTLISHQNLCATCGVVGYADIQKAQQVGDGWAVLEAAELAAVTADAVPFQKRVDLTPHPAEAVEAATVSGDKLYHLVPDAGHEANYAVFVQLVASHPELAFVGQYAPRSSIGQFRVTVRDGCLVLQERTRQENVRATPVLALPQVPAPYTAMVEQLLAMPGIVSDYDPATYADTARVKIAALVASKEVVAGVATVVTSDNAAAPAVGGDAMVALAAMLASVTPITEAPSAPARKKSSKKVSA